MTEKTALEHRELAQKADERVAESIERSDTDGFLSQWANGLTAQKHRLLADIAEAGGKVEFLGLYEQETGRRLNAKLTHGKYGRVWLLSDSETARYGRRFIPKDSRIDGEALDYQDGKVGAKAGRTSTIQTKLGLVQKWEQGRATAIITGSGTGLSGNAWVEVLRIDEYGTKFDARDL